MTLMRVTPPLISVGHQVVIGSDHGALTDMAGSTAGAVGAKAELVP